MPCERVLWVVHVARKMRTARSNPTSATDTQRTSLTLSPSIIIAIAEQAVPTSWRWSWLRHAACFCIAAMTPRERGGVGPSCVATGNAIKRSKGAEPDEGYSLRFDTFTEGRRHAAFSAWDQLERIRSEKLLAALERTAKAWIRAELHWISRSTRQKPHPFANGLVGLEAASSRPSGGNSRLGENRLPVSRSKPSECSEVIVKKGLTD